MVLLRSINALNLASSSVSLTYKSGKGKIENPLLHGESGDAPAQTRSIFAAWDITYAYTFSGPLFLSSLPESYFHGPHRLGVCRNSILPEINTKPTAKASPTFFSRCSLTAAMTAMPRKIVYAYKQTPTTTRSLRANITAHI